MESSSNLADAAPPWLELPREITAAILLKLGPIEILNTAQKLCTSWRSVCLDPSMWRSIHMSNEGYCWETPYDFEKMCRHAVDLSQGQLIDINIDHFGTDDLLLYISQRSTQLKRLQLVHCNKITGQGLIEAVKNIPFLEELHLHYTPISTEAIESVGRFCSNLKSFKFNNHPYKFSFVTCDQEALAIANNMPQLHHLELFGNKMTNEGLKAILDGCPRLESLDLRRCINVSFGGSSGIPLPQWIKNLRRPHDPINDYGFDIELHDCYISDDEYITGFSDVDMVSDHDDHLEFSDGSVSSHGYEDELFVD